jgi:hypothetical protein
MSAYLIKEIEAASKIAVGRLRQVVGVRGTTRLEGLIVQAIATGASEEIIADAAFILIGGSPIPTGWLTRHETGTASCSTVQTSPTRTQLQHGTWRALRSLWRPAWAESSRSETFAAARPSGSPRQSPRAPLPSS